MVFHICLPSASNVTSWIRKSTANMRSLVQVWQQGLRSIENVFWTNTIYQEIPKLCLQQDICGLVGRTVAQQFKVQQCESAGFQDHQTIAETFCNHTQSFGRDVITDKNVLVFQKKYVTRFSHTDHN
jgi:hypothetical protein